MPVERVEQVCDLGVLFDRKLTFHAHAESLTKAAYQRLGFVLRNASHLSNQAIRMLYISLVRSLIESNSVVWNPHEGKYDLIVEKVQKLFLRYMYKRQFGYYPFMYPTLFLQGHLGFDSLQLRRYLALVTFALKIIHGRIDSSYLLHRLLRLNVPNLNSYSHSHLRTRQHVVLALPPARIKAHEQTPVLRVMSLLNSVLVAAPQFDLFASPMGCLVDECRKCFELLMPVSSIK